MATVYLGLGSNFGDRQGYLNQAIEALAKNDVKLLTRASVYETEPVDCPGNQNRFLNTVLKAATKLSPEQLLETIHLIEDSLGRKRPFKNAPRTIDIDILLYDDLRLKTKTLTIPHPRMFTRAFVMKPLREIEPNIIDKIN